MSHGICGGMTEDRKHGANNIILSRWCLPELIPDWLSDVHQLTHKFCQRSDILLGEASHELTAAASTMRVPHYVPRIQ